jgi:hypothetical protein
MRYSGTVAVAAVKIASIRSPWRCPVRRASGLQHLAFCSGAHFCLVHCQAHDDTGVALVAPAGRHSAQAPLPVAFISAR